MLGKKACKDYFLEKITISPKKSSSARFENIISFDRYNPR